MSTDTQLDRQRNATVYSRPLSRRAHTPGGPAHTYATHPTATTDTFAAPAGSSASLQVFRLDIVHSELYGGGMSISAGNVILGMLSLAPMSGYDLVQGLERSVGQLWPLSKTQV